MKKLIMALLMPLSAFSQITWENNYPFKVSPCLLECEKMMYVGADKYTGTVTLFNDDHTVYKKVKLDLLPSNIEALNVHYVSRQLFNADYKIEFLVSFMETGSSLNGVPLPQLYLYSEDGYYLQILAYSYNPRVVNMNGAFKLIVDEPIQSPPGGAVYSLPGRFMGIQSVANTSSSVYPNPMSTEATISLEQAAEVVIYSSDGKPVRKFIPSNRVTFVRGSLAAGVYMYTVGGAYGGSIVVK